jgi:hypothetical protein
MRGAVTSFLQRKGAPFGYFPEGKENLLEEFQPTLDVFRDFKAR